jgi:hypothetical protein
MQGVHMQSQGGKNGKHKDHKRKRKENKKKEKKLEIKGKENKKDTCFLNLLIAFALFFFVLHSLTNHKRNTHFGRR